MDVYTATWSSVVAWTNDQIARWKDQGLDHPLGFVDWESHANLPELPNTDLVGPLSISVTEYDAQMFEVTLAIGVSTYDNDVGLFRLRRLVGDLFRNLMAEREIPYFDPESANRLSVIRMTNGTLVAPMTEIQVRPFQYVQARGLLIPHA